MTSPVIRVEQLSKRYMLGEHHRGYGTLRETIVNTLQAPARRLHPGRRSHRARHVWAVRDVSFDVRPGEVFAIIGRNGAGKSTLLKLLSRVTRPTAGRAEIRGRVGTLIEVGTGFHPELTGRENIYLNGTILGMKRQEIKKKFDEIVNFADIEQFLDTPVKRYSSGMYMRLAFSIAAHLEPEILIVDEVLAVGDAAFQKRCLGKMGSVAREGRTVLFVSHNMSAVLSLCNRACTLESGRLVDHGPARQVVQNYLQSQMSTTLIPLTERNDREGDGSVRMVSLQIEGVDGRSVIRSGSRLRITIGYQSSEPVRFPQFLVNIYDSNDIGIFLLHSESVGGLPEVLPAVGSVTCVTDPINLTPGRCVVHLELLKRNVRADYIPYAGQFDVEPENIHGLAVIPPRNWVLALLKHQWYLNES